MKTFSGRKPSQNEQELTAFIDLLRERNVTSYLEIGARHGDTFFDVMCSLPPGSLGVAVDYPGALWGTKKSEHHLIKVCQELTNKGYVIARYFANSTHPATIKAVQSYGQFGAALIDGDHTYMGVKKDWVNYSPLASLVALHDIVGHEQHEKVYGKAVEVPRFWDEIKPSLGEYVEFISEGSQMGIGVCLSQ